MENSVLILVEDFNFFYKVLIDKQIWRSSEKDHFRYNTEVFNYLVILCDELIRKKTHIEFSLFAMLKKSYQEEMTIFITFTPGIHSLYSLSNIDIFLRNFERVLWS